MSEWAAKRFWTDATVEPQAGGFTVLLDGRGVKTPAKATLLLPTAQMGEAIAAEWQAQTDKIDPMTMPFTRAANAAIDKVAVQHAEVADMIAAYGDSDLICYRAESPVELVERQAQVWDPLVEWSKTALGAPLEVHSGIIHKPQDPKSVAVLRAKTHDMSAFQLAAFHDLVSLSGSLIIGFAAAAHLQNGKDLWAASRVDEDWQMELWGEDEDALALAETKRVAFVNALTFYDLASA
jgi:chaperone required for assembly of F1-ATPase